MMNFDYNNAEPQRELGGLIPNGTIIPVTIYLREGGSSFTGMGPSDGGLFKPTGAGDAYMLDVEYTVTAGEFSKQKIWELICAKGNGSEGHMKWESIAGSKIRGILESAKQIDPKDTSDAAIAKRRITGFRDLNGLTFCARVGIEKSKDPQYGDKNKLTPIKPGEDGYQVAPPPPGGATVAPHVAAAASSAGTSNAAAKPNW